MKGVGINTSCFLVHSSKYTQISHHFLQQTYFLQTMQKEIQKKAIVIQKKKETNNKAYDSKVLLCTFVSEVISSVQHDLHGFADKVWQRG
uniref:Actin-related protein 2/3 complex subunit 1B n=1 Tax=Arundo donax TaxID=35708 RepID=A0A0A9CQX3_ARUDO